mmetsp:Transcript_8374/g.12468  ORF Transcript_8374/g.12468 Transcript_8374/m.12468 type:complete len:172 (+) Transcript_8374:25-540(+)
MNWITTAKKRTKPSSSHHSISSIRRKTSYPIKSCVTSHNHTHSHTHSHTPHNTLNNTHKGISRDVLFLRHRDQSIISQSDNRAGVLSANQMTEILYYNNGQQCTVEGTPVHREAYQSYHSTDSNVMNDDHSCGDIESDTTNWIDMFLVFVRKMEPAQVVYLRNNIKSVILM